MTNKETINKRNKSNKAIQTRSRFKDIISTSAGRGER